MLRCSESLLISTFRLERARGLNVSSKDPFDLSDVNLLHVNKRGRMEEWEDGEQEKQKELALMKKQLQNQSGCVPLQTEAKERKAKHTNILRENN